MLITKSIISDISIFTPSGDSYTPKLYEQKIDCDEEGEYAECYVVKESGDDPDVTAGIKIYSRVRMTNNPCIEIKGGRGIGKVTRPGLDQPVGEYAINSTPRKMIEYELTSMLEMYDIESGVSVEISVPDGETIAQKTFNPHMGIVDGISIIGTSGIVKPMSTEALIDTIKLDINMQYSEGMDRCIIVPGNYGVTFLHKEYGIDEKQIVLCSNFVGESIRMAVDAGFKKILFCSHIGKMIKVSGGIMNTHSQYGDRRMEFMCDAYREACMLPCNMNTVIRKTGTEECTEICTYDKSVEARIMECVSTTQALHVLDELGMVKVVSKVIADKSLKHLKEECNTETEIECILYENSFGELARSLG